MKTFVVETKSVAFIRKFLVDVGNEAYIIIIPSKKLRSRKWKCF
jgi:hypothetical protein